MASVFLAGTISGKDFSPVSEIRDVTGGDYPWRVKELNDASAGTGLVRSFSCLFTIPDYWPYAWFSSQTRCEMPGKLVRVRASGRRGDRHQFMSPAFHTKVNRYRLIDGRLYIAWKVRPPQYDAVGGRFSYVRPSEGPWEFWIERDAGKSFAIINRIAKDAWTQEKIELAGHGDWFEIQLILDPARVTVEIDQTPRGTFNHDSYRDAFFLQFGSAQTNPAGPEVVTEFREVFINIVPYPFSNVRFAEGPENLRSADHTLVGYIRQATPQAPRVSEGDFLVLPDGRLLAVYTLYYNGEGWDTSPARIVGSISNDGGRSWSEPWVVADRDEGSEGNVMSASLLAAQNGDLLLVYFDRTPAMKGKGMVLRRSSDLGKTWSPRTIVTPHDRSSHNVANNACLLRLSTGRIVLACREMVDGIRWPYACWSDDDGRTWTAGNRVPDPGLSESEKRGQNVNEPSICELADGRLLMTMRSIAGGQFFSWSADQGRTWTKPVLSPLRGACGPAIVRRIPGSADILAIWAYGLGGRTPFVSAVSSDGGKTFKHLKLLEQSLYHSYGYVATAFDQGRLHLAYMHCPDFSSLFRFQVEPGYIDLRFLSLPVEWFYRDGYS